MDEIKLTESSVHGDYREVIEVYTYRGITVPVGFHTNGASVPKWLQWAFDPFDENYITAAVIHDYLYYKKRFSRKEADRIFLEVMLKTNTPTVEAYIFYSAVRMCGWYYY